MADTQVLIVGAGPTGLTAAAALSTLGVKVRIIDKNSSRSNQSKALSVQAGTLACLTKALAPELAQELIRVGRPVRAAWIHLDDRSPIPVDLQSIPSKHNFVLILEQSETERILEEYLNQKSILVERGIELLDFHRGDSQVDARLRGPRGEEKVAAEFIIGCDGAHSTVRNLLGIPFKGNAYEGHFLLGDVQLGWPWPYDSIRTLVSKAGVIAAFPITGDRRYRLILILKQSALPVIGNEIDIEEFRAIASDLSKSSISILNATWLTRFRTHHRIAARFQDRRVFLAGDAAHIHSPAGGQGMNIGIQDALNLAFKLKAHLANQTPFQSLHDYERERRPVAKAVIRGTDLVFRMALMNENVLVAALRKYVLPRLLRSTWVQRRIAALISEMSVAERETRRYF